MFGKDQPLDPADVRDAMNPELMVQGRKGLGGPQRAETERMLGRTTSGTG